MKIVGFVKTSLIEWPGKIVSVIFVAGCNFRCPFCQNSHLVDLRRIKGLEEISEESILEELRKRKGFVDGVVVSGGEPTLQPDLPEFLKKCQKFGLETMIETNGSKPEVIVKLSNYQIINYFALDFKAPLDKRYAQAVGLKDFDSKIWIESLRVILNSGIPFELRTTVVPGIHDKKVLLVMAKQLKRISKLANYQIANLRWRWQNFQPKNCLDPEFEKRKPFSKAKLEEFLRAVRKIIPNVRLRDS